MEIQNNCPLPCVAVVAEPSNVSGVNCSDFEFIKVIGKGCIGKVFLAQKKSSPTLYAIKVMKKSLLLQKGEIDHVLAEQTVLTLNASRYLVSLRYSFHTPTKVYLVMDFVQGGDLFNQLQLEKNFTEPRAMLYTAMLVSALEFLHSFQIIYRDVKPENILFDLDGFIKLTDFGLCKINFSMDCKATTFCCSPEYMAPEMLQKIPYGYEVDWWSTGTLLYEMLTGLPPCYDDNLQEMYQKILFLPITFPHFVSNRAQLLMRGLLQRAASKRLGYNNVNEIKSHVFFASIDWIELEAGRIIPPWRPSVTSRMDTTNFDKVFTDISPVDSIATPSDLSHSLQNKFAGFSFVLEKT